MTDSKRHHRSDVRRESARTDQISIAVRVVLMIWEIVWTLVREHVLQGPGPGRLL
jgi:hypothetical protein